MRKPTNLALLKLPRSVLFALPWLIVGGGLVLTGLLAFQLQQREQAMEAVEFTLRASELINGLEHRLTVNAQILRGVAGLFSASGEVTRDEFADYVATLQLARLYPGIQAIGYAQLILST